MNPGFPAKDYPPEVLVVLGVLQQLEKRGMMIATRAILLCMLWRGNATARQLATWSVRELGTVIEHLRGLSKAGMAFKTTRAKAGWMLTDSGREELDAVTKDVRQALKLVVDAKVSRALAEAMEAMETVDG